jgi:DNA repair REX1-B
MASCAHTTAAFAVLSETINAVRSVLASHGEKGSDLEKLLSNLQRNEKEKLILTAAYHLERIRVRNEDRDSDDKVADKGIDKFLNEGVQLLKQKIDRLCIQDINETVEEIRYAMIEEVNEEME